MARLSEAFVFGFEFGQELLHQLRKADRILFLSELFAKLAPTFALLTEHGRDFIT